MSVKARSQHGAEAERDGGICRALPRSVTAHVRRSERNLKTWSTATWSSECSSAAPRGLPGVGRARRGARSLALPAAAPDPGVRPGSTLCSRQMGELRAEGSAGSACALLAPGTAAELGATAVWLRGTCRSDGP